MKIIVAGGRDFRDYNLLEQTLIPFAKAGYFKLVSGGAEGADKLGELFALKFSVDFIVFKAEWDKYGKSAGYRRNEQMAKYSDGLIAFWDGQSKGTGHMIDLANKYKLMVKIVRY